MENPVMAIPAGHLSITVFIMEGPEYLICGTADVYEKFETVPFSPSVKTVVVGECSNLNCLIVLKVLVLSISINPMIRSGLGTVMLVGVPVFS